ncbi:peptidoglycan editing factor PgeF [Anaerocolumna sp. AGMB13020]|uniref:peptidoglycan editing factor PgeF n=1 Tax=Anaerocolumna sp. AGMB13020 TaxID=3081750 RepID=UPI0029550BD5|nr:peptidoglycan editing factor PgeF [Anaerocolumna sp. AGMB13020]WOO36934.1 peptidoglycan editing factor PgeF [Anaerocolumna sp. AGMB13020]
MKLHTDVQTPFLTFQALSEIPFIKHGFTTRLGGVSEGCFESLNLSYSVGDTKEKVDENYRRICESLNINLEDVVATHQVHKTNVRLVSEADRGKGLFRPRDYEEVDGLITKVPGIPLATFYADCVPLYFIDKRNKAIGLSHSGWRGTVGRMGQKTLEAMKREFDTDLSDVTALIGPSICKDCYEISAEVAEEFIREFEPELKGNFDRILKKNPAGKYQLDLWEVNRIVLTSAGIPADNVHISNLCTCCNSELLFSHRASKGKRGTLAAFLMIDK